MTTKCEECKAPFSPRTVWQKYCGRKCQQKRWVKEKRKINKFVKGLDK